MTIETMAAQDAAKWPDTLTPALSEILGMMCFEFISLAKCARVAGYDLPKNAEAEQAFWMHRLLGHWFTHGDDWRKAAADDIKAMQAQANALTARKGPDHGRG